MTAKEAIKRFPSAKMLGRVALDKSVREAAFVFTLTRGLVFFIFILLSQFTTITYTSDFDPEFPYSVQEARISLENAPVGRSLRHMMSRGDCNLYAALARDGYKRHSFDVEKRDSQFYAFFPLYPLVLKIFSVFTSDFIMLGAALSNIFFFFALVVLHKLVGALGYDEGVAERTLFYLAAFPTSYFYSLPLTESLFLLLVVCSFYAAARDRWLASGALGALASATRSNGILLLPALAVLYWQRRGLKFQSRALGLLLVPLGLVAYIIFCWQMTGNPLAFQDAQAAWGRRFGFFLTPLIEYFKKPQLVAIEWNFLLLNTAAALMAFVCIYLLARRREWALALYTLCSVLMPLSTSTLLSFTRFVSVLFPIFIALGFSTTSSSRLDYSIRFIFVMLLSLMTALFASHVTFAVS